MKNNKTECDKLISSEIVTADEKKAAEDAASKEDADGSGDM